MATWRVLLRGENFWIIFDGQPKRVGFYTTRIVDGVNAESAELAAVDVLRAEEVLQGNLNEPGDSPMIYAEEIVEVVDVEPGAIAGFSFFEHETDS